MKLDEIRALVRRSECDEWKVLPMPAAADDVNIAVFRQDAAFSIKWGALDEFPVRPAWAASFTDEAVYNTCFEVFWHASLVDRTPLTLVDDHRVYLPLPQKTASQQILNPELPDFVYEYDAHIARLVHTLSGSNAEEVDRYISRAGFTITPELSD